MAYTATLARNIEVEDTGVMSLRLAQRRLGSINVTMLTYGRRTWKARSPSWARRARVRVGGVAVNRDRALGVRRASDPMDAQLDEASYQTTSVYGFGHPLYYDNVIRSLRGAGAPEIDGREGLRSLELLIAMYLSARDGKRVNLPLEY
jgi:UDP-N-acetyl-2-amino-2-deoxyglucuronate dehydrogenase